MIKLGQLLTISCVCLLASAQIHASKRLYKCLDARTNEVLYTSNKKLPASFRCEAFFSSKTSTFSIKNLEKNTLTQRKIYPTASPPSSSRYPKVFQQDQKKRDLKRRSILITELKAEKKRLASAQANLVDAMRKTLDSEKNRNGDLIDSKKERRILGYRKIVNRHKNNVEALQLEIRSLN